tara:strand:+ start:4802 stop:4936 length:135 start_codon:yes stop_codon:yes gene_type:complete
MQRKNTVDEEGNVTDLWDRMKTVRQDMQNKRDKEKDLINQLLNN